MQAMKSRSSEEDRKRLLDAGWESRLRDGLIVWRRPEGRGSWYSQEVAMEILEVIEEQEHRDDEV
jgi:tRNA(Glu) U13 pseudouridine synthase TruD